MSSEVKCVESNYRHTMHSLHTMVLIRSRNEWGKNNFLSNTALGCNCL